MYNCVVNFVNKVNKLRNGDGNSRICSYVYCNLKRQLNLPKLV